jgi:D-alanyl-D-alanine carboxypeptidase
MHHTASTRAETRWASSFVLLGLAIVIAAIIGTVDDQSSSAPSIGVVPRDVVPRDVVPRGDGDGALGEGDGLIADGASVFDGEIPAVTNLDARLLEALQRASTDAATDGVALQVNSGWRSAAYQEQLLREAVAEFGSEEEAARWVGTADTSAHVTGNAVDIGPFDATAWLSEHGAEYGLCQIYRNEAWHYELRPEATSRGCPPMYPDPTHDPRMDQ